MNTAGLAVLWALGMVISLMLIFEFIGMSGLVRMFPEGRRAWHLPAQLGSLGLFAILVINHPF